MFFRRKQYDTLQNLLGSRQVIVLTGMRRVGKTTLMRRLFNELDDDNKVFLDMENPLEQLIFDEIDFNNILNNLQQFGIAKNRKAYLFIDEIQLVPGVVKAIKYLYDHYDIKFMVTGSSSFYLKNLFPESLAGRKFIIELYPLDFEEVMTFKGLSLLFADSLGEKAKQKNRLFFEKYKTYYNEYLEYGGFPQVVLAEKMEKKKRLLRDIFTSYFEKDVKSLSDFRHIKGFRDLILLLLRRTGSKLDISKLATVLGLSRPTVYSYLSFLELTYFISTIKPYSGSVDKELSGAGKVYICDTGFVNLFAKVDEGNLFENAVFNNLKSYGKINYYQNRSGSEIDFILQEKGVAIEVKTKAIKQHIQKLERLSGNLGLKEFYVISKEFSEERNVVLALNL